MTTEVGTKQRLLKSCQDYDAVQDEPASIRNGLSLMSTDDVPTCCSYRLLVTFIIMFTFLCSYTSQCILGASLLTMIGQNHSHVNGSDGDIRRLPTPESTSVFLQDEQQLRKESETSDSQWTFRWSKSQQENLFTFFFLGYFLAQIPAGCLTHILGGRRVILGATFAQVGFKGLSIYAPYMAGYWSFLTVMIVDGFANGLIYVPVMDLLAKWAPAHESSVLTSIASSGIGFGVAVVYGISAVTSRLTLLGGWPFNFIVLGLMLLVLALLVLVLVSDTPAEHRFISKRELDYIHRHGARDQSQRNSVGQQDSVLFTDSASIPWRKILTSGPVYAIAVSQMGTDIVMYFCITLFPLYLQRVRHMRADTAGMVTGLPWLAFSVSGYLVSRAVDRLRETGLVSTTTLRKMVDGLGKLGPVTLLVCIVHLPAGTGGGGHTEGWHNTTEETVKAEMAAAAGSAPHSDPWETVVIALYVVNVQLLGCMSSSWMTNTVDLSPRFAGLVSCVCQLSTTLGTFLLPLGVQALTPHDTKHEWQRCMLVMLATVTCSFLIYVFFGSSQRQNWE